MRDSRQQAVQRAGSPPLPALAAMSTVRWRPRHGPPCKQRWLREEHVALDRLLLEQTTQRIACRHRHTVGVTASSSPFSSPFVCPALRVLQVFAPPQQRVHVQLRLLLFESAEHGGRDRLVPRLLFNVLGHLVIRHRQLWRVLVAIRTGSLAARGWVAARTRLVGGSGVCRVAVSNSHDVARALALSSDPPLVAFFPNLQGLHRAFSVFAQPLSGLPAGFLQKPEPDV
mmetsp:Transcript_25022/g.62534  ORF Transcript_25022/g.62534 Transcript_25022/m.62534 type:complete len:228 (-) Transcript_25022:219-902(-)